MTSGWRRISAAPQPCAQRLEKQEGRCRNWAHRSRASFRAVLTFREGLGESHPNELLDERLR